MRASDIRRGTAVIIDGKLFVVTNADHNTPGNLRAKVQFKLRDLIKGTIQDKRVGATDDIPPVLPAAALPTEQAPLAALTSESASRVLLATPPEAGGDLEAVAAEAALSITRPGTTGGDRLVIPDLLDLPLSRLRDAYESALPHALGELA